MNEEQLHPILLVARSMPAVAFGLPLNGIWHVRIHNTISVPTPVSV
jgi:hypothetical protein